MQTSTSSMSVKNDILQEAKKNGKSASMVIILISAWGNRNYIHHLVRQTKFFMTS